jgi:hypothetical protein
MDSDLSKDDKKKYRRQTFDFLAASIGTGPSVDTEM